MVKLSPLNRVVTKCKSNKLNQVKVTRRSARLKNRLTLQQISKQETERQQQGCHIFIQQLPNEILLHIFKYLSSNDLWYSIRMVCRRWAELAKCYCLWETIEANRAVPTNVLQEWLKIASNLKTLKLFNRKDADVIIEQISKCNRQLVSIEARNCWGSSFRRNVKSKPLCNLLRRCPMLSNINFEGTHFISCQFYKLMAKHSLLHSSVIKRRKSLKTQNTKVNSINYFGYANGRQIRAVLLAETGETHFTYNLCQRHSRADFVINFNSNAPARLPGEDGGALMAPSREDEYGIFLHPVDNEGLHVLEPLQDAMNVLEVPMDDIDEALEYIGLL